MSTVGRKGEHVVVILTEAEADLVHQMISTYLYRIGDQDKHGIPLPPQLFPDAYPDDPEASAEFAGQTRESLLARKIDNAELVNSTVYLEPPLLLGGAVVERWLSTFTDLRLLLADELGIRSDDDEVPDTDGGLVYQWLGAMQQTMVEALMERP